MKTIYMIKDLALKSGLSIYTLKYYLKIGMIKEIGRSPGTSFRYFDDSTVSLLEGIRNLRRSNISLNEIKTRMGL